MRLWHGLAILIATVQVANAQDCTPVLDEINSVGSSDTESTAYYSMCSSSFAEFSRKWGGAAAGSYGLISGGAHYDASSYNSTKSRMCTELSQMQYESAYEYSAQKILGSNGLRAYQACLMNRSDFTCIGSPASNTSRIVNIILTTKLSGTKASDDATLTGAQPVNRSSTIKDSDPIPTGTKTLVVERTPPASEVTFTLNILTNGQNSKTCSVYIPPVAPKIEKWDPVKILSTMQFCYENPHIAWRFVRLSDHSMRVTATTPTGVLVENAEISGSQRNRFRTSLNGHYYDYEISEDGNTVFYVGSDDPGFFLKEPRHRC